MHQHLSELNVEGIAKFITENRCRNVVVMCGAAISMSVGIQDFRTTGTGLYNKLARYKLPRPEAIFELDYFRKNPAPFYELVTHLWPGNFEPTPAHYFVRLLHEKGILRRCYTQNIDSLEHQAGIPSDLIVAAHGNFDTAHVIDTHPTVEVDVGELKAALDKGRKGWTKLKSIKGGLVKPGIVLFGEELSGRFFDLQEQDFPACDLLIIMGSSLGVQRFADLVDKTNPSALRLLINREPTSTSDVVGHCSGQPLSNG